MLINALFTSIASCIFLTLWVLVYLYRFKKHWQTQQLQQTHELGKNQALIIETIKQNSQNQQYFAENMQRSLGQIKETFITQFNQLEKKLTQDNHEFRRSFDTHLINTFDKLQQQLLNYTHSLSQTLTENLQKQTQSLNQQFNQLINTTDTKLQQISGNVEKRLFEGFEKTTATFADILKRLALIDEAQKKITELSSNVVSLQEILVDKRARGAFGEVQLTNLIENMLPKNHYELQHQLPNHKRVDCMLFLPEPTGNIAVDAKFPLESYQNIYNPEIEKSLKENHKRQFRHDIKKHIEDIAEKYIIRNETAEGAIMFIPAEAIFAEIHSHYPDLVELANKKHVWLTSPTTMMAILTTVKAVIKDAATRKQLHLIQEHLYKLGEDFQRFQKRMDDLARHIDQANEDVKKVHTSAKKISIRFKQIEQAELTETQKPAVLEES